MIMDSLQSKQDHSHFVTNVNKTRVFHAFYHCSLDSSFP